MTYCSCDDTDCKNTREIFFENKRLKASIAQLESDKERLIKERDLMQMCLNLIDGSATLTVAAMKEIARTGLKRK